MTITDYISELDPKKAKKIEEHNGATPEEIKEIEEDIESKKEEDEFKKKMNDE